MEDFGMEYAKNNLMDALVSLQDSIDSKNNIKVGQIKKYLECSESFFKKYFGMQKFTNIFFGSKQYDIYQMFEKQIDLTKDDASTLQRTTSAVNGMRMSRQKVRNINDIVSVSLDTVFRGPLYQSLVNDILDKGIYNKRSNDNEQINESVEVPDNKTDPEQIEYNTFSPSTMALSFIRESSDNDIFLNGINFNEKKQIRNKTINEKETIVKNLNLTRLNEKMNKVFLNSRRLMFQQVSQQLLKTYGIDIFAAQDLYVDYISETDTYKYMTFSYNNQIYKIQQQKKPGDVNFGFVLEIYRNTSTNKLETTEQMNSVGQKSVESTNTNKAEDTEQNNFKLNESDKLIGRFFIKKYHKGTIYSRADNVGSTQSLETKISSKTSTSFASSQNEDSKPIANKRESERFLDLKEPFIYKVLEQLNIGPKVHFVINPYVNRGFYIATKDISGDEYFSSMTSMEKKIEIESSGENKFLKNITEENIKNLSIGLSELNLVGLMYSLEDLNTGNYGYIFPNEKDSEDYNQNVIDTKNFKIIDFASPCYREDKKDKVPFNEKYEFKQNIKDIFSKYYRIKFDKDRFMDILKERIVDVDIMKQAISQFEKRLQKLNVPYKEDIEDYVGDNFGSGSDDEAIKGLRHISQQAAQCIIGLMNTERGESEDEVMLRHPTETVEVNGVTRKRNRTNAELIGFKNGDAPDDVTDPMKRLQYLNNAIEDLCNRCIESIISNYRELKKCINE